MEDSIYLLFLTVSLVIGFLYFTVNSYLAVTEGKEERRVKPDIREVTAVIPVYNEDPELFEKVIKSVSKIKFVVVGDGCSDPYYSITKKYGGEFVHLKKRSGKRVALAEGFKRVRTKYVLFLDSDTVLEEGALEQMLSSMDEDVGGVSPRILMMNNGKLSYYYAEFFERMSEVLQRALSRQGKAAVLYGHCALYKREAIKGLVLSKDFVQPKVLGMRILIGDDRQLTNYVLNHGYKAKIDYKAIAYTMPPKDIRGFFNQLIRWTKANYLYFFEDVLKGTIVNKGTLYAFNAFYTNVLPLLVLGTTIYESAILGLKIDLDPQTYVRLTVHLIYRILDFVMSGVVPIFVAAKHVGIHNGDPNVVLHVWRRTFSRESLLTSSIHLMSSLSTLPFAVAVFRMVDRDKVKVITIGSIALVAQMAAAVYALLTLWKQEGWRTR
ncbi:MAG: glycosyl transferase family protein [Candidatus Aramenus sulfurataquae]|jgi:cellulose synthase/poly-beta-1,6-N-acetylglucosamine synthase-like glycosyltransferase|uniref:Glycosyl transferase family protein n=2 Tax=Candidatus Aramenus sulfurataquae TaxID=1326980 RepID=W7KPA8_9CREN|nr:MAG: glycosyl transferase family protein [Candidatus Aramenus sulfurataquae]MCL7344550.1 glycosyltransferase [Candidatus Aramenus sulfurataquae]